MKTSKVERLKAAGWKVGSAEDFLQLSDEEARLAALKLSLISAVKNHVSNNFAGFDIACAHRKWRNNARYSGGVYGK